jgi:hypothetical protein
MELDQCYEEWQETGDTHYECGMYQMKINNTTGGFMFYSVDEMNNLTQINSNEVPEYIYNSEHWYKY